MPGIGVLSNKPYNTLNLYVGYLSYCLTTAESIWANIKRIPGKAKLHSKQEETLSTCGNPDEVFDGFMVENLAVRKTITKLSKL